MIYNWLSPNNDGRKKLEIFSENNLSGSSVSCICGFCSTDYIEICDRYGFVENLIKCEKCKSIYQGTYSSNDEVMDFYKNDYRQSYGFKPTLNEYIDIQKKYGLRIKRQLGDFLDNFETAIEVGAGTGAALSKLGVENKISIDLDNEYQQCWNNFDVKHKESYLKGDGSTILIMNHVLEHIVNPKLFFSELAIKYKFDAVLIVVPYIFSKKRGYGYGNSDVNYIHPAHVHNSTAKGIAMMFEGLSFKAKHKVVNYRFGVPELYMIAWDSDIEFESGLPKGFTGINSNRKERDVQIPFSYYVQLKSYWYSLVGYLRQKF